MNATPDSSRSLAPLSERRRAVLIGVLGFGVLLLSQVLGGAGVSRPAEVMAGVAGLLLVVLGWTRLLFPGLVGLPRMGQPDLDERQQAVLTRAYAVAYQWLAAGLLLAYVYATLTDLFAGLPRFTASANSGLLLVGLMWAVLGLPTAVLAWTEPDPAD